jgi:UDP-3-O-[3-hydroxymyristoyl] glucosamine N-acyltransferase
MDGHGSPRALTLSEVAALLGGEVEGDGGVEIRGVAGIEGARPGDLTFLASAKHAPRLLASKASAVIVGPEGGAGSLPAVRVASPYLAFAKALEAFHPRPLPEPGVHPTAVVSQKATVGPGARIGPFVVIEEGVRLGRDAALWPHVVLHRGAVIGDSFVARSHAVVREGCRVGDRVILQDGAVVGADGFGFAKRPDGSHQKIPQVGIVVLEDDVEIQANACVDRATVGETRIRRGTKVDNLVQVGHSCDVGEDTLLCAQVGLGGSTTVGKGVTLAGQVGVADHARIGSRVMAVGQAGVHGDVPDGSVIAGSPQMDYRTWLRATGAFARLGDLAREVKALRAEVDALRRKAEGGP